MLSVWINTRNRADLLRQTLDSLAGAEPPEGPWEVVVVDNGSTDETPAVIASFTDRLPLVAAVEELPGRGNARRRAAALATGQECVFTDDDVLFDRPWLRVYERAFREHPECAVFGGPVRSRYDRRPPEWLLSFAPFSIRGFDLGPTPREIDMRRESFLGANWAVRRGVLEAAGGFRDDLGVDANGRMQVGGEETELQLRLLAAGARALYLPEAGLDHHVPEERCTADFILDRAEVSGRTTVRMNEPAAPGRQVLGVPLWAWRRFLASAAVVPVWHLVPNGTRKMERLVRYRWHLGVVREFIHQAHTRAPIKSDGGPVRDRRAE